MSWRCVVCMRLGKGGVAGTADKGACRLCAGRTVLTPEPSNVLTPALSPTRSADSRLDEERLSLWLGGQGGAGGVAAGLDEPPATRLVESLLLLHRHACFHEVAAASALVAVGDVMGLPSREMDKRRAAIHVHTLNAQRYSAAVTFLADHPVISCLPLLLPQQPHRTHPMDVRPVGTAHRRASVVEACSVAFRALVTDAGGVSMLLRSHDALQRVIEIVQPLVVAIGRLSRTAVGEATTIDALTVAVLECALTDMCRMCVEWASCTLSPTDKGGNADTLGSSVIPLVNDSSDTRRVSGWNSAFASDSAVAAHFVFMGRLLGLAKWINATQRRVLEPHRAFVSLVVAEVLAAVDAMVPPTIAEVVSALAQERVVKRGASEPPAAVVQDAITGTHQSKLMMDSASDGETGHAVGVCDLTDAVVEGAVDLTLPSGLEVTLSPFAASYVARLLHRRS